MSSPPVLTANATPSSPNLATAQTYLPALTGIRAIAAYLVFLHHFNPLQKGPGIEGFLFELVNELHIGVGLFFVLSGFLIALRYYGTEQWTGAWWGRYLRNRVARIYPMYFGLTCLTFAFLLHHHEKNLLEKFLLNITFLRGFSDEFKFSGINQGWTLTVEECFYLFAPVAFLWLRRRPRLLWLLPLGLLGVGSALVLTVGQVSAHGWFGNFRFMLLYTFFGRAIEFFVGVQLALWYRSGKVRPARGLLTVAGIATIGAVILGLAGVRGAYEYGQQAPLGIGLNNAVLPIGVALLYAGLLTEATWLRRLLASAPLQLLGKSSYVFYLIHLGFAQLIINDFISKNLAVQFVLLNLLSIGLFHFLEEPINRWLRAPSKSAARAQPAGRA